MTLISIKPLMTALIALMHPFFISVIEINHNEKEATLEISVRTFTDDLEKMISKEYNVQLDLSLPKQKEKADELIKQYMQKKLALTTNGAKSNIEYEDFAKLDIRIGTIIAAEKVAKTILT